MASLPMRGVSAGRILAGGAVVAAIASIPSLLPAGDVALFFDNLQQLVACLAALFALLVAVRSSTGARRRICRGLLFGLTLSSVGLVIWDVGGSTTSSTVADVFLATAVAVGTAAIVPAIFGGLSRWVVAGVALDTILLFLTGINLVSAVWWSGMGSQGNVEAVAFVACMIVLAGSGAGIFALVARRSAPYRGGAWVVLGGLLLASVSWVSWLVAASEGIVAGVSPADFAISAGVLLVAHGATTWDMRTSREPRYERVADLVATAFPVLAIVLSVVLDVTTPRIPLQVNVVAIGTGAVVLVAAARQLVYLGQERRARDAERRASERLALEVQERAETALALALLEPGETPEETAQRICAQALTLEGIDVVTMHAWTRKGVVPLASLAATGRVPELEVNLPPEVGERVAGQAAGGCWVESFEDAVEEVPEPIAALRLRATANATLRWEDRMIGAIGLGTRSEEIAATLHERLATVREFGVVASALLGPALVARERRDEVADAIQATIDARAFRPVFQPIVDLTSGRMVGFESLTRFADGTRPDIRFGEAGEVGMAIPLEMAVLRAAFHDATRLPGDAWISVNVSPRLATAALPLIAILEGTDRDVVVEITEHVEIDDYARLVGALGLLHGRVRIAVDDAGAGYAGLRHILELRPHFVKLDITLVRAVDTDPGRRAMVASMVSFARETGASLIAEGVETAEELHVLRELGVEYGQGYLLAKPDSASAFGGSLAGIPRTRRRRGADHARAQGRAHRGADGT